MGIHKEVRKMFGSSVMNYIIAARTTQGYEDAKNSTKEERLDILTRWREHKDEYQNVKMNLQETGPEGQASGHLTPRGFMQTRHLTFDERKKLHDDRKTRREEERRKLEAEQGHSNHRFCPFCRRTAPHTHEPSAVQTQAHVGTVDADHFEQAIHDSVAATSRGNVEEDLMIERAIRASVRELQSSQGSILTDEEALNRAIQASISEAGRHRSDEQNPALAMTDEEAEHQNLLEQAIQASLAQYQLNNTVASPISEEDADHEAHLKLAMQMSKEDSNKAKAERLLHEHRELEHALEQSKNDLSRTKTEEDVVLEYVQKQSLLETEHKKTVEGKRIDTASAPAAVAVPVATPLVTPASSIDEYVSPADEEALRRAIEESMNTSHGAASGSVS